jgi:hypothetical protein
VPIFKKRNSAHVTNYGSISVLNNVFKSLESIIYDHLPFNFKSKLHPSQHCFVKSQTAVTNLVTYLNDDLPSVGSQEHLDLYLF